MNTNTLNEFSAAPSGLDDMAASLSNLFNAFQNLAADPANFGRRRAVARAAQKVTAQFNAAAGRLRGLEANLRTLNHQDAVPVRKAMDDLAALQNGLNTLASHLITQVNTIYVHGSDLNGGTGRNFFTGTNASDIGVNSAITEDPALLQAGGARGDGKNAVAQDLANLAGQNISTLGNQTFVVSNNFARKRKIQPAGVLGR